MRGRPRPHPRNAPPALCDTTSAAPTRTPGTRPPDNPRSSAPDRTATNGRSHAEGTPEPRASAPASVRSTHLEPHRQPEAPEPPRPKPPPTPAARVAQTRHRPPLTTPHGRSPSEPPDPATGTPTTPTVAVGPGLATRPRTARSPDAPRILLELSPDIAVVAIIGTDVLHRVIRGPERLRLPRCCPRLERRARPGFADAAPGQLPHPRLAAPSR